MPVLIKSVMTFEYSDEFAKHLQAFGERFQFMRSKQKELNVLKG